MVCNWLKFLSTSTGVTIVKDLVQALLQIIYLECICGVAGGFCGFVAIIAHCIVQLFIPFSRLYCVVSGIVCEAAYITVTIFSDFVIFLHLIIQFEDFDSITEISVINKYSLVTFANYLNC